MIETVARALGSEVLQEVAFVGGCTTGLLLTDEYSKEGVRYTDDVDLIINVVGYPEWAKFQRLMRSKGFMESLHDEVNCRMRLGELQVDFMPNDEKILGYGNRWYAKGLETSEPYELSEQITIKLLTPPYFVATKFEAYSGRGGDDPLGSHDFEDILTLIDGRPELVDEIENADAEVKAYIADKITNILSHRDIESAVQSAAAGDVDRESLIFERMEAIKDFG
jgi:predicted nucleotidyltransferase